MGADRRHRGRGRRGRRRARRHQWRRRRRRRRRVGYHHGRRRDDDRRRRRVDDDTGTVSTAPGSDTSRWRTTTAAGSTPTPTTGAGEITYPLSFPDAEEQGIEVDWGERCNTETGRLAIPDPYAQVCFAPFEGDNGGATDEGVTADSIKIVLYQEQEADPIIKYITDAVASDDTNAQRFETMQNMVRYYEAYHEMYGRTVELIGSRRAGSPPMRWRPAPTRSASPRTSSRSWCGAVRRSPRRSATSSPPAVCCA